jgi:hypothetical protein
MNDPTGQGPVDPGQGAPPTEEELRAAFEEQMRSIRVEDVLLQTAATLVNLGAHRLGLTAQPGQDPPPDRDLPQAQLAIDGARALVPLCPPEQSEPIRQALAQLQIAFAQEAQGGAAPPPGPSAPAPGPGEAARPGQQAPGGERTSDAKSRIWTPPGS